MDLDIAGSNPVTHPWNPVCRSASPYCIWVYAQSHWKVIGIGSPPLVGCVTQNLDLDVLAQLKAVRFK